MIKRALACSRRSSARASSVRLVASKGRIGCRGGQLIRPSLFYASPISPYHSPMQHSAHFDGHGKRVNVLAGGVRSEACQTSSHHVRRGKAARARRPYGMRRPARFRRALRRRVSVSSPKTMFFSATRGKGRSDPPARRSHRPDASSPSRNARDTRSGVLRYH